MDVLQRSFDGFANLFEERQARGIFTTEDSVRYLFFHSLLQNLGVGPNDILLDSPHPADPRKEIDMIVVRSDRTPELAFEFKFHRAIPSGRNSPRPMMAGQMFKDIFRLDGYRASRPDSRCFFVYCTDREMKAYLGNPANNLADLFNLGSGTLDIDEGYVERNSKTLRESSGQIRPCRIAGRLRMDLANNFSVRIFES